MSVAKSQQRVLKGRERLAQVIKRNEELTKLRQELQQFHWEKKNLVPSMPKKPVGKFREIELHY